MNIFQECVKGNIEYVGESLDKGANINEKDELGFTLLMIAAINGYDELTKMLLHKGADLHVQTLADDDDSRDEWEPGGDTALLFAVDRCCLERKNCYIRTICVLLEAGADVNAKNHIGDTALKLAFQHHNVEVARLLIEYGADLEKHTSYKCLPFYAELEGMYRWLKRRRFISYYFA
jgi:uncharacterized protein